MKTKYKIPQRTGHAGATPAAATRQVMRHRVRDALRDAILAGSYAPGQKLAQEELARKFGVSRVVVREALMELRGTGLLTSEDNCGVRVAAVDPRRLLEACELRELLEVFAVRRCCDTITLRELRELRELVARMAAAHAAGQRPQGASLDREFHLRLLRIAGNSLLQRLTEGNWFLGKVLTAETAGAADIRASHLAILDAIQANDPARAEAVVRKHMKPGYELAQRLAAGDPAGLGWVT
ncbi:MAG: GntR family transcriptional regulator [Victivallales bacterium]